ILRNLAKRDCYIKVFPFDSSFEDLKSFNPDGYFLSNGPGDPEPLKNAQEIAIKIIEEGKPLFGICLVHQTIALANGITTYKVAHGRRGTTPPLMSLNSGTGGMTPQARAFAVAKEDIETHPESRTTPWPPHAGPVGGMRMKDTPVF